MVIYISKKTTCNFKIWGGSVYIAIERAPRHIVLFLKIIISYIIYITHISIILNLCLCLGVLFVYVKGYIICMMESTRR